ncbi:FAD-binding protein [Spirochaetia bacterium]|nr:FAD-binding protein [Spirochaetia bacterium]
MAVLHSQVIFPSSLAELFSIWNRFPDAVPFAGGTSFLRLTDQELPELPKNILSLERIDELRRVIRTERYLEIGAMVKLSDIIALGKTVPEALSKTLLGIAGPQLRNLATIGGNICSAGKNGGGIDAAAPMAALDARYELRSASQSRWISALRFSTFEYGEEGQTGNVPAAVPRPIMAPRELLTRIRIPLEQWDSTVYRKFHARDLAGSSAGTHNSENSSPDECEGVLIFILKTEKNILTDIRAVFAGSCLLRDRNSEIFLEGRKLPLDKKDVFHHRELWKTYLSGLEKPGPLLKAKLLNSIEACIAGLAD